VNGEKGEQYQILEGQMDFKTTFECVSYPILYVHSLNKNGAIRELGRWNNQGWE